MASAPAATPVTSSSTLGCIDLLDIKVKQSYCTTLALTKVVMEVAAHCGLFDALPGGAFIRAAAINIPTVTLLNLPLYSSLIPLTLLATPVVLLDTAMTMVLANAVAQQANAKLSSMKNILGQAQAELSGIQTTVDEGLSDLNAISRL